MHDREKSRMATSLQLELFHLYVAHAFLAQLKLGNVKDVLK